MTPVLSHLFEGFVVTKASTTLMNTQIDVHVTFEGSG